MRLRESAQYEREYHDPAKRTNANSIQVFFKDGTKTPLSEVLYPLGHRRRRREGIPVLIEKFEASVARVFAAKQRDAILEASLDQRRLEAMPVNEFMDLLEKA
jgi:2-methylcitrate dehydratase